MRACKVAKTDVEAPLSMLDLANTGAFGPRIQSKVRLSPSVPRFGWGERLILGNQHASSDG
jgi:hypothetical protein